MNRPELVRKLLENAEVLKARGATSLYVFGSTVRDEAKADSDLDLFIDYDPNKKFSLIDLAALRNLLEDDLGLKVDLTTRDSLHPALREEIEHSAERIF
jgi:predicted nucleotidyltransferase